MTGHHLGRNRCPLYGIAGWSLFRGFSFYCGNGDAIGTSVSVRYIVDVRSSGVVVKRGSTVHADFNYLTMYGYDAKRLF